MQAGTVVLCRAGRYRQLYLVDQHGTLISRDTPRILGLLKCSPDTPPLPLPQNHNDVVSKVRQQFEREVHARRAEQEHTLSLSPAQQYVLTELRIAYGQSGPERQAQIALLERAFRQPLNRHSLQEALKRLKKERLTGEALIASLTELYHLHTLDVARPEPKVHEEESDPPHIVCSEGVR
jgi:hypothetical protein